MVDNSALQFKLGVTSEIGVLRKVVLHLPGLEWDLVPCTPGSLASYLIEDIFSLKVAKDEHECFSKVLGHFVGKENVLEFVDLLSEVCEEKSSRLEIVASVAALESLGRRVCDQLLALDAHKLALALIRGAIIENETDRLSYANLFAPLPNLLFTRDLGAAIPGAYIICHAAMPARRRETLLMRYVLKNVLFKDVDILDVRDGEWSAKEDEIFWTELVSEEGVSIEGGDIIVLDEETLIIGTGERTTWPALMILLKKLRRTSSIKNVIRVVLPQARATMHLDTVFTVINRQEFMIYEPVIKDADFYVYQKPSFDEKKAVDFSDALGYAGCTNITFVQCGNGHPLFGGREQWTDGVNVFAVAPDILVGYERNTETIQALKNKGYQYLHAGNEMDKIESAGKDFKENKLDRRIIIGLPGSELSRGRGGPRCMSMPLLRDPLPQPGQHKGESLQRWC